MEEGRKEKEKLKKMNVEELADYWKKKQEEENKRDIEAKRNLIDSSDPNDDALNCLQI